MKKLYIEKALDILNVQYTKKILKQELINALSNNKPNIKKLLNISYKTLTDFIKNNFPNKPKKGALDIYLLKEIGKKYCNKCGTILSIEDFGSNSACKKCHNIEQKNYYNKKPQEQAQRVRKREAKLDRYLTQEEINYIFIRDNYKCCICNLSNEDHLIKYKTKLHLDHIIPSSKGGKTNIENIQLLCKSCNSKKSDKCNTTYIRKLSNEYSFIPIKLQYKNCPYCNKQFKNWKSVRGHVPTCIKNTGEYFIDLVEGLIHYTQFNNIDKLFPNIKSRKYDIKKSFSRRNKLVSN